MKNLHGCFHFIYFLSNSAAGFFSPASTFATVYKDNDLKRNVQTNIKLVKRENSRLLMYLLRLKKTSICL